MNLRRLSITFMVLTGILLTSCAETTYGPLLVGGDKSRYELVVKLSSFAGKNVDCGAIDAFIFVDHQRTWDYRPYTQYFVTMTDDMGPIINPTVKLDDVQGEQSRRGEPGTILTWLDTMDAANSARKMVLSFADTSYTLDIEPARPLGVTADSGVIHIAKNAPIAIAYTNILPSDTLRIALIAHDGLKDHYFRSFYFDAIGNGVITVPDSIVATLRSDFLPLGSITVGRRYYTVSEVYSPYYNVYRRICTYYLHEENYRIEFAF